MTQKYPILISIPHGSTFVPAELKRKMDLTDFDILRQSDPYTDIIFDVPNAYVVKGRISRLVADLNRAPDDIEMENQLSNQGVVVSVDLDGNKIYKTPPSPEAISQRVRDYHDIFHQTIETMKPKVQFMIDGHSMRKVTPVTKPESGKERPDICLGNRHFTTCSHAMTRRIARFFEEKGFGVTINDPFTGRYIIGYHCSRRGLPGIQVEINEKLYINTKTYKPDKKKIAKLNLIIAELVEVIGQEIEKTKNLPGLSSQRSLF